MIPDLLIFIIVQENIDFSQCEKLYLFYLNVVTFSISKIIILYPNIKIIKQMYNNFPKIRIMK